MADIIDGRAIARELDEKTKATIDAMVAAGQPRPGLAVILVGEDGASQVYVRRKIKACEKVGIRSFEHRLAADASQDELLALINWLNKDPEIHGILCQVPLPPHIDTRLVLRAISPEKDVDGFHPVNAGRLATGLGGFVPCTPYGCLLLLQAELGSLSGKSAVVIGRSNIVGKPMALLLLGESATVTIAHSRTQDLPAVVRQADIVVAAVGRPEMVKGDWLKPGATVIDVGINRVPAPEKGGGKTRLVGDVDYAAAARVADWITPVPGGVGPVTIAMLMANTVTAAARKAGRGDIARALTGSVNA